LSKASLKQNTIYKTSKQNTKNTKNNTSKSC